MYHPRLRLARQTTSGNRTPARLRRQSAGLCRAFAYDDLIKADKINLDIFRLKGEALEDFANLPAPEIIAAEIVEDLEAALQQFAAIAADLKQ